MLHHHDPDHWPCVTEWITMDVQADVLGFFFFTFWCSKYLFSVKGMQGSCPGSPVPLHWLTLTYCRDQVRGGVLLPRVDARQGAPGDHRARDTHRRHVWCSRHDLLGDELAQWSLDHAGPLLLRADPRHVVLARGLHAVRARQVSRSVVRELTRLMSFWTEQMLWNLWPSYENSTSVFLKLFQL